MGGVRGALGCAGVRWGAVAEVMGEAVGEAVGDREGSATSSFLAAP